jgi:hypothetical protein
MRRSSLRAASRLLSIASVVVGQVVLGADVVRGQWQGKVVVGARAFGSLGHSEDRASSELDLELRPRFGVEWGDGTHRVDVEPFLRVDLLGDGRTRFDLRDLAWTGVWDEWFAYAGIREVFWGVTESSNVVDIINQRSPVGAYDGYEKLGQPMIGVGLVQGWGVVEAALLPGFREREFVGRAGNLWSPHAVDEGSASYESEAGSGHVGWTIRWAHTIGDLDVALTHFAGTSREPRFRLGVVEAASREVLIPHYELTDQTGAELQWTAGAWLWKVEAMTRTSAGGRYGAGVAGLEYAVADYFSLFAEYALDTRGDDAMTSFEHDAHLGAQLLQQDGRARVGIFVDTRSGNRIFRASFERRLGDRFTLDLGARWFGGDVSAEPPYAPRQESLIYMALVTYL